MRKLITKFLRAERGNVAVAFGLAAVPIVGVMGVAVDYTRASHFRAILQSAVDDAALAGASEVKNKDIRAIVDNYMKASLPGGLALNNVTYSTDLKSDTIEVTAKARVPTTIAGILMAEMPVSATATASRGNPIRVVDISVTNFNSDAWDANSIYWYIVPEDGSLPKDDDLQLLLSNDPAHPAPTAPSSVQIGVDDEIGFAMINVTGGVRHMATTLTTSRRGACTSSIRRSCRRTSTREVTPTAATARSSTPGTTTAVAPMTTTTTTLSTTFPARPFKRIRRRSC